MKQTTPQKPFGEGTSHSAGPFFSLTKTAAAASVAGLVFAASPAHLAFGADSPFVQKFGPDNPLKAPIGLGDYQWARPACVDIDGDGDLDIFIGASYSWINDNGYILYFENTGDASTP